MTTNKGTSTATDRTDTPHSYRLRAIMALATGAVTVSVMLLSGLPAAPSARTTLPVIVA